MWGPRLTLFRARPGTGLLRVSSHPTVVLQAARVLPAVLLGVLLVSVLGAAHAGVVLVLDAVS